MHPHLWGVFSSCVAERQLHLYVSIVALSGYDEGYNTGDKLAVNKMQAHGLYREESRKRIKAVASKPKPV
jgi:hypothetical protein